MTRYFPLIAILGLLGAMAGTQAATAASPSRPTPTFAHPTLHDDAAESEEEEAEEAEAEEDEAGFEECEASAAEFEFEPGEEEVEEEEFEASCDDEEAAAEGKSKGGPFVTAPAACRVSQAESTITALPAANRVRLTIRYRTYAPAQVIVGLKLKDRKGSVGIEHATRHLGGKGVLHLTTRLGTAIMERALAATEFDVSLRVPATPGFCLGALEQRLHSVKHTGGRAPRVYKD